MKKNKNKTDKTDKTIFTNFIVPKEMLSTIVGSKGPLKPNEICSCSACWLPEASFFGLGMAVGNNM